MRSYIYKIENEVEQFVVNPDLAPLYHLGVFCSIQFCVMLIEQMAYKRKNNKILALVHIKFSITLFSLILRSFFNSTVLVRIANTSG